MKNTTTSLQAFFPLGRQKMGLSILLLFVVTLSCKTTSTTTSGSVKKQTEKIIPKREHTVQSLLWQQNAAEYKALCYQAYNLAKLELDKLAKNQYLRPIAIVTDIDETVLDNSPYNARMVKSDKDFTKDTWYAWGKEASAKAVPGALEFFNYAHKKGVTVYYLSNRDDIQKTETIENLKKLGFPGVDKAHVLLRNGASHKKPRRDLISQTHQIVMLFGDNLSDFSELFDKQSTQKRNQLVNKLKTNFGTKFIVLPNPMYGDWETKGIYEGSYKWTDKQKDSIRKTKLRVN
jgi:5'-nucleotidase (lipoprotein e(P4) family)